MSGHWAAAYQGVAAQSPRNVVQLYWRTIAVSEVIVLVCEDLVCYIRVKVL